MALSKSLINRCVDSKLSTAMLATKGNENEQTAYA